MADTLYCIAGVKRFGSREKIQGVVSGMALVEQLEG
jgi:hypothetical protein